jgi:hypothetical protein
VALQKLDLIGLEVFFEEVNVESVGNLDLALVSSNRQRMNEPKAVTLVGKHVEDMRIPDDIGYGGWHNGEGTTRKRRARACCV